MTAHSGCPFCGSGPEKMTDRQTDKVCCPNIGKCGIGGVPMTPEQWESRYVPSTGLHVEVLQREPAPPRVVVIEHPLAVHLL